MWKKLLSFRTELQSKLWWNICKYIFAALFCPFIYLSVELYNFKGLADFRFFAAHHPGSAIFGVLITLFLCGIAYLAIRRAWIAATVIAVLYHICGLINYIKVALNGDNFMPWDLTMAGNMGELMSFTKIRLPFWMYLMILAAAVYIFLLWFAAADLPKMGKLGPLWRSGGAVLLCATLLFGFTNNKRAEKVLGVFGMSFMDGALQSSNYVANGFISAFTINLASISVQQPDGYSEQAVHELLSGYQTTKEENSPDVIVILSESFWDIEKLPGTEFSKDPMYLYKQLCTRDNAYSGTLYCPAIGGGTVHTEFNVLTGLTTDYLPSSPTPYQYATRDFSTYVSNYKDQGYTTLAMHPYDKSFYGRDRAYGYVGFDDYYGETEIEQMVNVTRKRGYISDDSFADAIIRQLEQHKDEKTFLWGISMENHQTYYPLEEKDIEIQVKNASLSGSTLDAVVTYTQGVYHANQALEKLVNYIDAREKDTVLVFFGDHLPTLGANREAYMKTGLFSKNDGYYSKEDALKMFGTPFIVYGNFDMKDGIFTKTDNQMSSYYLLDAVALSTSTRRTPYMNLLLDEYQNVPYYNKKLHMDKTKKIKKLCNIHKMITYDRLVGKQFSD